MVYRVLDNYLFYKEKKVSNGYFYDYEKIVKVFGANKELVLSSEDKTEEEFLNYLGFLVEKPVVDLASQLLKQGMSDDELLKEQIYSEDHID